MLTAVAVLTLALGSADLVGPLPAPAGTVAAPFQAVAPGDTEPAQPAEAAAAQAAEPRPPAAPVQPARPALPAQPGRGPAQGGPVVVEPDIPSVDPVSPERTGDEVVRVGSDYILGAGDTINQLVVVMGTATIEGHVAGDLVVILGEARLGPMAVVDGDVVVVGGSLGVRQGAAAHNDLVVVGGALDAPPGFMPGGEQVVFGFRALGDTVRGVLPWLMRGLLLGRPIVPDLGWVWAMVGILFLVYLGVLLVFEHPVRLASESLATTPLRALVTGLVVLLLAGPVLLLLAASVIGLIVVPFALCAIIVAGLVGKIAAARWLGARVLPEGETSERLLMIRSFTLGCAILVLIYMVPVIGGVVWAIMGATGLGAATLAFMAAYRKENPPAAPVIAPPPPLPPLSPQPPPPLSAAYAVAEGDVPSSAGPAMMAPGGATQPLAYFPRATFTDRLAAFALDAILVAITVGLLDPLDEDTFLPLFLFYRSAFWAWKGATVGGIICQLRVARLDGAPLGAAEALVRGLGSIFSVAVLGIGCLWVLRDPEGQAWHDKMAGTCVVKVPRNHPL